MILNLGQYAKALRVAFKMQKVLLLGVTQLIQHAALLRLAEPVADSILAGVSIRRVADVVGEAGSLDNHPQVGWLAPVRHLAAQHFAHPHTERAPDTAYFQAMGQAGVNVIVAGYRVNLGFLAQAAEGAGKNDAVVILVKGRAPQFVVAGDRFAQSFAAQQCFPIHAWLLWLGRVCGRY